MATALSSYFGIIGAIDCTDDLWIVGTASFIVGIALCAAVIRLLKYLGLT